MRYDKMINHLIYILFILIQSSIEKDIMKFILLHFEHSLLLLLSIKIKQPPIVHLPNLNDYNHNMKRSSFTLKYQKYHPINWLSNPRSRIDVGWIDFIFQFSQWSITASVVKVITHFRFLHFIKYPIDSTLSNQNHQKNEKESCG